MLQTPSTIVKKRSREMTNLTESFTDAHADLVGTRQRVCVVDVASDGTSLVGHTMQYKQVRSGPRNLQVMGGRTCLNIRLCGGVCWRME